MGGSEGGGIGAVDEILGYVSRMQIFQGRGEVVAAGNGDGTEPGLVGGGAVGAVLGEGVLGGAGGVAGDLLQGVVEVLVEVAGVVVVEGD